MKIGDILIDHYDKQWLLIEIDYAINNDKLLLVFDFKTQKESYILLENEVKEVIERLNNVEFLCLKRRVKDLKDIKEYL